MGRSVPVVSRNWVAHNESRPKSVRYHGAPAATKASCGCSRSASSSARKSAIDRDTALIRSWRLPSTVTEETRAPGSATGTKSGRVCVVACTVVVRLVDSPGFSMMCLGSDGRAGTVTVPST